MDEPLGEQSPIELSAVVVNCLAARQLLASLAAVHSLEQVRIAPRRFEVRLVGVHPVVAELALVPAQSPAVEPEPIRTLRRHSLSDVRWLRSNPSL